MYRRFGSRRAVGSQIKSATGPVDPLVAILGANLREYWSPADALRSGSNVTSLTGRLYGLALTATGAPQYTASDATLNNAPAIRTFPSNVLYNDSTIPAGFIPAGSRPFLWMIGYTLDLPTSSIAAQCVISTSGWLARKQIAFVDAFTHPWRAVQTGGTADGPNADDNFFTPFVNGVVVDASVGTYFWQDGVSYSPAAAATAATGGAITTVVVGGPNSSGSLTGDVVWALAGVCTNPPTPTELAALYAYAQTNYGVP